MNGDGSEYASCPRCVTESEVERSKRGVIEGATGHSCAYRFTVLSPLIDSFGFNCQLDYSSNDP